VAPLFSAKSVDGVRAYELARKLYKAAQRAPVIPGSDRESQFGSDRESQFDSAALQTLHRSRIVISELELLDFVSKVGAVVPASSQSSASARIHVADTSALGLPEATVRIACSKGTYIRAFARDLGEALGSGAHLSGLIRSRSGDYRLADALSVEQALALFQ